MKSTVTLALVALVVGATQLCADTWNKKTKVTFSAPVEIPGPQTKGGVVVLPPGTYVFRLLDSPSNRHILQVLNPAETKVYSTILAINDYRLNASSKTVVYFSERKAGAPTAIKAWFYPGDNFGQRLVYPKVAATQIAAVVNQPVPSHEADVKVAEETKTEAVPVVVQTPAKQEVAYAPSQFTNDATDTAGVDGTAVKPAEPTPKPLPKTASPIYLIGLMGFVLLLIATLTRKAIRQN